MAKRAVPFSIAESDLKKLPRSEQRRMSDLGYVVATKAEANEAAKAEAKGK